MRFLLFQQDAEVQEAGHGRGYSALLMEAVQRHSIQRLGFEDAYMTCLLYTSCIRGALYRA